MSLGLQIGIVNRVSPYQYNEIDSATKQPTGRSLKRKVGYVGKTKDFAFWSKEKVG